MRIFGVDFTSRPGARKPIIVASARLLGRLLRVEALRGMSRFDAFEDWLVTPGPWVGGFDFPFGLPRAFVERHAPARDWVGLMRWVTTLTRDEFCAVTWPAFRAARGRPDLKHRRTDAAARSHSPLKTMDPSTRQVINPPVGLMFYEGAPRLAAAGLRVPGLHENGDARVALETYPGWLAARLGARHYKNDNAQTASARRAARRAMLRHLAAGEPVGIEVGIPRPLARACIDDAGGDRIDALLCAVLAASAALRAAEGYGLPRDVDPVEGWIAGVAL